MATATLVNSDIEIGRRIVAALTRASVPVTVYLWAFIPQLQEWQFMIATPLVDTKGPLAAYGEVNRVLQREGVFDDVPLRRIFLKSPNDRVLKSLEKESRAIPREAFRVVNEQIAGSFVEDAYVYSGSIDIMESANIPRGGAENTYFITYTPYSGPGDATVRVNGLGNLRQLLLSRLHISPDTVESTLKELYAKGGGLIPNVHLRAQDLKRLKPA
ncbi:MAG: hypothetical protein WA824_19295 [Candidatus Sulfotelmatobacter sp.]